MQNTSKLSVIGIVTNVLGEVLWLKRRDVPVWVLPGGGVEQSETPQEAIVREVKEETGIEVSILRLVAHYTPLNRLAYDTFVFECRPLSGQMQTGSETLKINFFSPNTPPTPFFFLHNDWLQDAQKQLSEPIVCPIYQVTYFQLLKYFCCHPVLVLRLLLSRMGIPLNSR